MSRFTGVAQRVHDTIAKASSPQEARLFAAIVVGEALQHDLLVHHDIFQHQLDRVISKRMDTARRLLSRTAISKAVAGDNNVGHLLLAGEVLDTISKAAGDDEFARDPKGRFSRVESRTRINYFDSPPLPNRHAARMGVPPPKKGTLPSRDKAAYQQAYAQVASMVSPYASAIPGDDAVLQLTYQGSDGRLETKMVGMPHKVTDGRLDLSNLLREKDFADGERLVEAAVRVNPGLSAQGAAFDLVGSVAGPTAGMAAGRALAVDDAGRYTEAARMKSFAEDWNTQSLDSSAGNRAGIYRRFSAGSQLLSGILGDAAPPQLQLALAAGDFVGQYGAEAEKVIGPTADRTAYRYRGVEKKPDPSLQRTIDGYRRTAAKTMGDRTQAEQDQAARNALIYGRKDEQVAGGRANLRVAEDGTVLSPLMSYFRSKLVSPERLELQRASGVIPPSQGIIIDRHGKVVTEAVGYGEDWYLPFNLKTLSMVKGGEYVRTRAYGGPTTEDVYGGLVSGARATTVISNHGVYTVEYDPAFRGSRRYSDKAARMVKRYGALLDAVKSKQVTLTDIPQDRVAELRTEASLYGDPKGSKEERQRFRERLDELTTQERDEPQLSVSRRNEIAQEFLADKALDVPNGEQTGWESFADTYVQRKMADAVRAGGGEAEVEAARIQALADTQTPERVIVAAGFEREWGNYLRNAERKYKHDMSPLHLNGEGYARALEALQEQFPYYISSVTYTPFTPGSNDPGYVKPRYTRPEGALAGYFDPTIEGEGKELTLAGTRTGKVTADQTRWQAGRDPAKAVARQPHSLRLLPQQPPPGTVSDAPSAPGTPGTSGTSGSAGRAGGTPTPGALGSSPVSSAVQARKQEEALVALWYHLRDRGQQRSDKRRSNRNEDPEAMEENYPTVFAKTEREIRQDFGRNPTAVKESLLREARAMDEFWTLNDELIEEAKDPGYKTRGVPYNYREGVRDSDKTYNFGPEFDAGSKPEAYLNSAKRLLGQLGLDASDPMAPEVDAKLNEIISAKDRRWVRQGEPGGPNASEVARLETDVMRAVQVKQLRRRVVEARQAEADIAAAERARLAEIAQRNNGGQTSTGFQAPAAPSALAGPSAPTSGPATPTATQLQTMFNWPSAPRGPSTP